MKTIGKEKDSNFSVLLKYAICGLSIPTLSLLQTAELCSRGTA